MTPERQAAAQGALLEDREEATLDGLTDVALSKIGAALVKLPRYQPGMSVRVVVADPLAGVVLSVYLHRTLDEVDQQVIATALDAVLEEGFGMVRKHVAMSTLNGDPYPTLLALYVK